MKSKTLHLKKAGLLVIAAILTSASAFGAAFTAVASGSWSSSATWGIAAPPSNVTLDQIVIPSGITVTLDNNVSISGALATLDVQGTLSSASNYSLTVSTLGTVTGTGAINVGTIALNTGAVLTFTGSIAANTVTSSVTTLQIAADVMATQTLNLAAGTLSVVAGGSVDVGSNSTIVVSGGALSLSGGTVGLSGNYHVTYTNGSAIAGVELSGAGLTNVNVDVGSGNAVTLNADLFVDGTLSLTSGSLVLNGNDLTITGNIAASGNGTVSALLPGSDVNINASGSMSGSLNFTAGANAVNNVSISVGANNQAQIGGSLAINGSLQLTSGTLNVSGASLTINGSVSGSGSLSGNASSNISITTSGGLSGALNFAAGGQIVNDFSINVGSGNSVSLGSGLTVGGDLSIANGSSLDISGQTLTLGAGADVTGSGSLSANASSGLVINASGGITAPIVISGGTIGSLTVNVGSGNNVTLGSDLSIAGTLNLQSGTLVLSGYDLDITGDIAASGSGTISSTGSSNISITSGASTSGSISFDAGGSVVGNLTIGAGAGGSVSVGSDVTVNGTLNFLSGNLNLNGNDLTIGASGSIIGAGSTSYIITGANGTVGMQVTAGASTATTFPIGTSVYFAPAAVLLASGSASGEVQVGVAADVKANGTAGADISGAQPMVDATWFVHSDVTANLNMTLDVAWSSAMEVNGFNSAAAYISHYTGGAWDASATAAATAEGGGMFSLQRAGITSLSPFAVFDANTVTGIERVNRDLEFVVFPNPASTHVWVKNNSNSAEVINVDVTNMIGELVGSYRITGNMLNIPLDGLYSGNYFIRLYNNNMNVVKKFTKM